MRTRLLILLATAGMIPLSFVRASYPEELVLQHVPTVVGIILLASAVLALRPTRLSFTCIVLFLWIHLVGARWIYSFVPYDVLAEAAFGVSLSDLFGWERNHYDRFVHLASGLLGVPPASEILQRVCDMRPRGAAVMAVASVLSIGAMYEILEWQIAVTLSPAHAEAYNGQQGDVWDPQKDMALALIGAIVSAILIMRWVPGNGKQADSRSV